MPPLQDKDSVTKRLTPQLDLPACTRNTDLLKTLDTRLRRDDTQDEVIAGLDQYQQTAFNLLPQRPSAGPTPASGAAGQLIDAAFLRQRFRRICRQSRGTRIFLVDTFFR